MTQAKKTSKKVERSRLNWVEKLLSSPKKFSIALWALVLAVWVGAVIFVVQLALAILFKLTLPSEILLSNWFSAVYSVLTYGLSILVIVGVPRKLLNDKTTRDQLGLRGLPTWTDLLLSPIGFVVSVLASGILTALMMLVLPNADWAQSQDVGFSNLYSNGEFILAFLCLVVLAPIAEEIIFRGYFYGKLRSRMKALPAMLIVSLLFGIMHMQLNVGVVVFAMSMIMCFTRELTGTIWAGILIHMIKNGVAFYMLYVTLG